MIKVIDNALRGIPFSSLGAGATFKNGSCYYIKTDSCEDNAVDIATGELACFEDDETVTPFNCELIIL